jgi:glycosyltransferase involved in cell wall biosynthesis
MPEIDVLIPTYDRPGRVERVWRNVVESTTVDHSVVFIVEANDTPTIDAVRALGLEPVINELAPNYSGAISTAVRHTTSPYLFAGADDLRFHPGWAETVMVVGTNDLLNPYVAAGMHATHYLVNRRYIDEIGGVIDGGPGSFLHPVYTHQYTDTEFIGTAKARARFRPCLESVVEHLHAYSGKGEPPDATTAKGHAQITQDSVLYDQRRPLWQDLSR